MPISADIFRNLAQMLQNMPVQGLDKLAQTAGQAVQPAIQGAAQAAGQVVTQPTIIDPMQILGAQAANSPAPAAQRAAQYAGMSAANQNPQAAVQAQTVVPQQQAGYGSSQPVQRDSSLGGTSTISPNAPVPERGVFQSILDNLTGRNLQTPEQVESWKQGMAIGALGNRLGSSIAGGDQTGVGRAAGSLADTFAGNLIARNTEERETAQDEYLGRAAQALGGMVGQQTPSVFDTSSTTTATASTVPAAPTASTAQSAPSRLGSTTSPIAALDGFEERLRRISGL